ncbi:MAG: PEGA domain-containing protein [Myxococcales bacterium]|nr:PEGA domain-containing protein [Myxococcales bacterium]
MKPLRATIAAITALAVSSAGCTTITTIRTNPDKASVYLNGQKLGETPVQYNSKSGLPTRYRVQLQKEGYRTEEFYVDTPINVAWAVLLGWMVVPLLWAWEMDSQYNFNLRPDERPAPALPPPPPPPAMEPWSPPPSPPATP